MRSLNKGIVSVVAGAILALTSLASAGERITNVVENIAKDTVLEGEWQSQSLITPSTLGNGHVTNYNQNSDNWYDDGTSLTLEAVPNLYHQFDGWTGQTNISVNPLELIINEPLTNLVANFSPKKTEAGTPHYWYANHGITNNFDWHDVNDYDEDVFTGRKEYIWGTNPNDETSYPRIGFELYQGNPRIEIPETTDRSKYTFFERLSLTSGGWDPRTNVIGRTDGGPVTLDMQQGGDGTYFYKVGAELSE
jgi:hypothetical protein